MNTTATNINRTKNHQFDSVAIAMRAMAARVTKSCDDNVVYLKEVPLKAA